MGAVLLFIVIVTKLSPLANMSSQPTVTGLELVEINYLLEANVKRESA